MSRATGPEVATLRQADITARLRALATETAGKRKILGLNGDT